MEFWRPIRAKGCQNLTKFRIDLKMVPKRWQRKNINLQIHSRNICLGKLTGISRYAPGGADSAPPPFLGLKKVMMYYQYIGAFPKEWSIEKCTKEKFIVSVTVSCISLF